MKISNPHDHDRPRLRKALGQHHLVRSSACRPLVDFLRPEGLGVVEIGSGGGVLTRALVEASPRFVWAVELDLAWGLGSAAQLAPAQVLVADVLVPPWERLPAGCLVAGNLPYNVGTVIVQRLLSTNGWARAGFLLQLEVAERIAASPGAKAYSGLSVLVAARAEARLLGRVAPGAFRPPPKVDSAFVGLVPKAVDPRADDPLFVALVRGAFQRRRKTLANALEPQLGRDTRQVLESAGLDSQLRPERVSLDGWLGLVGVTREGIAAGLLEGPSTPPLRAPRGGRSELRK